ncbi:TPA: NAD-dependent epimerase/dehydratase family protein [Candidatus Woesearchaeota archaeon]|nr:NAD-dependent epimerase/dehydratase family protein [Candidatus Woesearchaeota archaeon]HIH32438.1 NAD-dependent epimerase/dehydratase family protein [Candidatus Woesearchaeota archaeon]HIH55377.1 NAD-dependent epimerase/dehydratase family protein [Candidatus Woesearchaeota archaeon]HIJ02226.1 NAD-dependent epimerase/dehydratase family protein [Candidatus Woesearchaeota archaeon]HIJ14378.1 NAD-dependent epimerase/dehydratase family protein [Candidatus Woesearchaeota archaeon]
MAKQKVLITGGSGFLGINLVRHLYNKGYDIAVIDLVKFDYPDMKDKITFLQGDIRHVKSVEKIMKGCSYVVHCAAALPLYSKEEIFTTDVDGTRIVLEVAEKHKVRRAVHISSTAVYGIPDHHPLKENDRLEGVGNYGQAKILAEEVCLEFRNKGMIVPILRPKSFVGPERLGVFAIYYDWVHRGKNIPIIGTGKNRYQLLDVEDLCEVIHTCIVANEKKVNDTFNIGARLFTTMAEDFGAVLKHKGSGKKVICIPAAPLIFLLRVLEFLRLSPLYKWVYETAPEDSFVSIEKAQKQLKFKPKYSNKQALIRNYEWYLAHLDDFKNQTGVSHRVPWKQGILKVVSWFF